MKEDNIYIIGSMPAEQLEIELAEREKRNHEEMKKQFISWDRGDGVIVHMRKSTVEMLNNIFEKKSATNPKD